MFWAGGLIGQLWGVGSGVWCVGLQHSRQNWPDRGWCWAGKNTRDELVQQGHWHIMPSQTSVVPAGNHTIFLQQLARSKPVVPRPFDVFVCVFQGTERWTSKSSLLQVLISIQGKCSCGTCGDRRRQGAGGMRVWGGTGGMHSWDVPPQLGFCCLLLSPRWTKQRPYLSGSAVQAGASFPHALSFGCGPGL